MAIIPQKPFGRSGHTSSRAILGAAAFWEVSQNEADAALELAFSYGINHLDTAPSYGESELRIGSWIRRHGKSFFLATKTLERTAAKARQELHRSLERLVVNQVDLWQLHNLVDPQEWAVALGAGGALEAAIAAREQGLVRFIGVTGHGLNAARRHLQSLERFDFDAVLLPFSYTLAQNAQYLADFKELLAVCQRRNVAVQTIKAMVRAPWDDQPRTHATWYEPLDEQAEIDLAVHWVLGHPGLFLITAGDTHLLPKVLEAANRFQSQPSEEAMQAQMSRLRMRALFTE